MDVPDCVCSADEDYERHDGGNFEWHVEDDGL